MKGKKFSESAKENMRKGILKRMSKFGMSSKYNVAACFYMESLKPKYNFQHALNGGEFSICGYFLDGYDKENNVAFEYDEFHHFYKKGPNNWTLKKRDIERMKRIKKKLKCSFLRYDEKNKILTLM